MGLFVLFILVFLAMYMSVFLNTERVLEKFGSYPWEKGVWRKIEIALIILATLAVIFDIKAELACTGCALIVLIGGIVVYFRFSSTLWKIALIIAVIMLIAGAFYSIWLILFGSLVILIRSMTILDD